MTWTAERYHDISCGHRVYGHESKCAHLHGHNYRVHFKCTGTLDSVGRVIDFSVIKAKLCMWLEDNWDHKFLVYAADPMAKVLQELDPYGVVITGFNPTAENIAKHMVDVVAPLALAGEGVVLYDCKVEETRKCSASYQLGAFDFQR